MTTVARALCSFRRCDVHKRCLLLHRLPPPIESTIAGIDWIGKKKKKKAFSTRIVNSKRGGDSGKRKKKRGMERLSIVREALGEPYYERDGCCLLYNVDCVEALERLGNGAIEIDGAVAEDEHQKGHARYEGLFDLTVTSPPYNIGKEYETVKPLDVYVDWCERWIKGVYEHTRPAGAFWLNVGYVAVPGRGNAVPLPYLLYGRCPFFLQQEVVWHYGAGVACKRQFSPRNEKFLWYVKDPTRYAFHLDDVRDPNVKYPNQRKNGVLRCNPLGKNPTDVWDIPKVTSGRNRASAERTPHPAQFPEAVVERVIRASSDRGDLVLDPFLGSGTTAKVAIEHGRTMVGFELRQDYCAIAVKRIESLFSQHPTDARLPPPPTSSSSQCESVGETIVGPGGKRVSGRKRKGPPARVASSVQNKNRSARRRNAKGEQDEAPSTDS